MAANEIVAPHLATCHRRVIDFFVAPSSMAEMVIGAVAVGDALCKPHKSVRLYFRAGARTMMVRTLKSMGNLELCFPMGWPKSSCLIQT